MLAKEGVKIDGAGKVILTVCAVCFQSLRRKTLPKCAVANNFAIGWLHLSSMIRRGWSTPWYVAFGWSWVQSADCVVCARWLADHILLDRWFADNRPIVCVVFCCGS